MQSVTIHKLPSWAPMAGITLGSHVFVKDPADKLTVNHELVHVAQQAAHPVWFWFSYLFFPLPFLYSWRWKWEAEAYKVQLAAGCSADELASMIAGSLYLWPCRKETALRALQSPPKP